MFCLPFAIFWKSKLLYHLHKRNGDTPRNTRIMSKCITHIVFIRRDILMCLFRAARCIHVRFYTRSCATWIYPSLPKYWHIINTFFLLKMFSQHNTNAARNSQKLSIVFRGKTRRTICRSKISGTSSPGRACRSQVSPRRLARPRLGPREVRGSDTAAPGGIRCPCTTVRPAQRKE